MTSSDSYKPYVTNSLKRTHCTPEYYTCFPSSYQSLPRTASFKKYQTTNYALPYATVHTNISLNNLSSKEKKLIFKKQKHQEILNAKQGHCITQFESLVSESFENNQIPMRQSCLRTFACTDLMTK